MGRSDACLSALQSPTNATLIGGLTPETKPTVCKLYSTSVTCVKNLIRGCNEDEGVYARHIIEALDQGLGQLCHEDSTYKRYSQYSACYKDCSDTTGQCMSTFSAKVQRLTSMGYEDLEEDSEDTYQDEEEDPEEVMCRIFLSLMDCVRDVITSRCGTDAASLFQDLVKAHVPTIVCEDASDEDDVSSAGSIHPQHCVFYLCAVILVPLVSNLVKRGH